MNTQARYLARGACSAFLLAVCTLAPGCQSKDAEHLAEFGSRLAESVRNWAGPNGRPIHGLESVPLRIGELALDARVTARLKWDKELAESAIQARSIGESVVELSGKVASTEAQRRAVELAQTTVGVEKVLDKLEIGTTD
jgi:hypothetical protein